MITDVCLVIDNFGLGLIKNLPILQGEGVSYRGRILVQLETQLDAEIEDEVTEIPQEEVALVQPFLRRRKYKLYSCFMEATMIAIDDSPVEFEISIGTFKY
jgi:hypothetical protein